jgi:hypothetical protein
LTTTRTRGRARWALRRHASSMTARRRVPRGRRLLLRLGEATQRLHRREQIVERVRAEVEDPHAVPQRRHQVLEPAAGREHEVGPQRDQRLRLDRHGVADDGDGPSLGRGLAEAAPPHDAVSPAEREEDLRDRGRDGDDAPGGRVRGGLRRGSAAATERHEHDGADERSTHGPSPRRPCLRGRASRSSGLRVVLLTAPSQARPDPGHTPDRSEPSGVLRLSSPLTAAGPRGSFTRLPVPSRGTAR